MLQVEKEMVGLLMNGASTPVENIRVSFFLVVWPSFLLALLRMVRHEKEKQGFTQAESLQGLARDFAKRAEGETGQDSLCQVRREVEGK